MLHTDICSNTVYSLLLTPLPLRPSLRVPRVRDHTALRPKIDIQSDKFNHMSPSLKRKLDISSTPPRIPISPNTYPVIHSRGRQRGTHARLAFHCVKRGLALTCVPCFPPDPLLGIGGYVNRGQLSGWFGVLDDGWDGWNGGGPWDIPGKGRGEGEGSFAFGMELVGNKNWRWA